MALLRKAFVVILAVAGGVVVFVWLQRSFPHVVAQIVAFRPVIAGALLLLALRVLVVAVRAPPLPRAPTAPARDGSEPDELAETRSTSASAVREDLAGAAPQAVQVLPSPRIERPVPARSPPPVQVRQPPTRPSEPVADRASPSGRLKMVWLVLGALATATLMVASVTWVLTRPHDVSAPSTPQPPRDELSVCGHDLGFPNADILASILGSAKIEETLGRSTSEVANRGRLHPSGGKWARQRGLELLVYESPAISVTATASAGAIFEVYVKLAARHPELAQALAELGSAAQLEDLSRVTCQTAVVEYRTTPSESHLTISDPAGAGRYWGNLPLMPVGRIARVGESVKANLADSAGREEARVDGVAPELRLTISDPRSPRNLAAYPFTASAGWEVQVADVIDGPAKELVLITTDYAGGSSVRLLKWSANELRTFWSGPGPVTFVPNASRSYSIRDADGVLHEYQPSRAAYN